MACGGYFDIRPPQGRGNSIMNRTLSGSRRSTERIRDLIAFALVLAIAMGIPGTSGGGRIFSRPSRFFEDSAHGPRVEGWQYDADRDRRPDWIKRDLDGDGVVDAYLIDRDRDGIFDAAVDKARAAQKAQRHLIVCIDSIPFSLMEELWREGHFRDFHKPSAMISTFPSDTNPAFTEIAGTEKTPGVEDRYYDRQRNGVVGGVWDHIVRRDRKTDSSFHALFDYEQHPRWGGLIYLSPYSIADHDLKMCRKTFWRLHRQRPPEEPIFLYIGSTDAVGHREGRTGMLRQLLMIEEMLDEIFYRTEGNIRVSLFSDHGNNLVYSDTMIDLGRHLARHGFRLSAGLKADRDVVVPRFGLVGDVCIYTLPEQSEQVAEALASLEGADFSVYRSEEAVHVVGRRGKARIEKKDGRYRYAAAEGDPLLLGDIVARLGEQGALDKDGFAEDAVWFEATKGHVYPDILRRLAISVENHVVNTPDVIVSLEEGYCYGSAFFVRAIDLLGTHGSAFHTQTNGMAMSTAGRLPDFIRASDLLETLGEGRLRRSPRAVSGGRAEPMPPEVPTATPGALSPEPTATATGNPTPSPTPSAIAPEPTRSPTDTPTPFVSPAFTATQPPPTLTPAPAIIPAAGPAAPKDMPVPGRPRRRPFFREGLGQMRRPGRATQPPALPLQGPEPPLDE